MGKEFTNWINARSGQLVKEDSKLINLLHETLNTWYAKTGGNVYFQYCSQCHCLYSDAAYSKFKGHEKQRIIDCQRDFEKFRQFLQEKSKKFLPINSNLIVFPYLNTIHLQNSEEEPLFWNSSFASKSEVATQTDQNLFAEVGVQTEELESKTPPVEIPETIQAEFEHEFDPILKKSISKSAKSSASKKNTQMPNQNRRWSRIITGISKQPRSRGDLAVERFAKQICNPLRSE